MKNIRILVLALLLVGALAAPVAAFPPQCEETCSCSSLCTQICAIGNWRTNCGVWGDCQGMCFARVPQKAAASSTQALQDAIFAAAPVETSPASPSLEAVR